MSHEYSVHIFWSQEDGAYLAVIPELPGCIADGQSREESLENLKQVALEWIEVAKEEGRNIPNPLTAEDYERATQQFNNELKNHIQREVASTVNRILKHIVEQQSEPLYGGRIGGRVFSGSIQLTPSR